MTSPTSSPSRTDHDLVLALRAGDASAFAGLVDRYGPLMIRVARSHVATHEAAQDVVQDAWLALLKGIDRFEERASLRTWLFRVLTNIAKTRGIRDKRPIPASTLGPTVDRDRFRPPTAAETAIAHLPERRRGVVWLRDVAGFDSDEVCDLLDLTAGNQRVLLHRGRAGVRQSLKEYL
ncbi:MAG: sigma-70 family RNA polymerase sigma factor [Pseudonocardiales bacterium]